VDIELEIDGRVSPVRGVLFVEDCVIGLQGMPDESVDLVMADPPFNVGKNYDSPYKDRAPKAQYIGWCEEWLTECIRVMKPGASIYLFNYPENNAYLMPFLDERLCFKRWLTWHYPTNTGHSKWNYTRTQYSILYYCKGKDWDACTWNKDEIGGEYKNPTDKRVKKLIEAGKRPSPYDVFTVNQVKNTSYEKTEHICQIPISLLEIFIRASSNVGDLVVSPFGGSGSALQAGLNLGRCVAGFEVSPAYGTIIATRLDMSQVDAITYARV
jgi:site-specific DNA-methyltransferase (adenine-specific)